MKPHIIDVESLNGTFETLIDACFAERKRLVAKLEIEDGGGCWAVYFEVIQYGLLKLRTQQLMTALREYNAL